MPKQRHITFFCMCITPFSLRCFYLVAAAFCNFELGNLHGNGFQYIGLRFLHMHDFKQRDVWINIRTILVVATLRQGYHPSAFFPIYPYTTSSDC